MVDLRDLEKVAREIGRLIRHGIDNSLGKGNVGFALLLFDFGGGGHLTYVSNANREDMLRAIAEFQETVGQKLDMPPAKTGEKAQ
jgi:diaminopimelate decarboxylase